MAYTTFNFKTKKALKEQVRLNQAFGNGRNAPVRCYNPGLGGPNLHNYTGKICLEGPHYPQAHSWYAEAELKDGIVIKIK